MWNISFLLAILTCCLAADLHEKGSSIIPSTNADQDSHLPDVNRDQQPPTTSETPDKCRGAQGSQSAGHMDKCAESIDISEKDKNKSQAYVSDNSLLKYYLQGNFGGPVSVPKTPSIRNEGPVGELYKSPHPSTSFDEHSYAVLSISKSASKSVSSYEDDKNSKPSISKSLPNSKPITSKESAVWDIYKDPIPSTSKHPYIYPQTSGSGSDSDWDAYKSHHLSTCYVPFDMSKGPTQSTSKTDADFHIYSDPCQSTSKETYDVFKDPIPSTSKENPGWDRYFNPRPSTSKDLVDNPKTSTSQGIQDHGSYTIPRISSSRHHHVVQNPAPSTSMYIPDYNVNKNPTSSSKDHCDIYLNPTPSTSKCILDEPRPSTSKDTRYYYTEDDEELNGNEFPIPNYDDPLDISKHIENYTGEHGLNLSMKTSAIFDILGIVPVTTSAENTKMSTTNAQEGSYMNEFQKFITVGTDLTVNRKAKKHRPSKKQTDEKKD